MKEKEIKVMTQKEIKERLSEPTTIEAMIVKKFGEKKGLEIVKRITNSQKTVRLKKRDENVVLKFHRLNHISEDYSVSELYIEAFNEKGVLVGSLSYELQNLHNARLNYIEILDENYVGQGLGSIMLKELEDIGKTVEIYTISGKMMPMGEFGKFTRGFYERNGFKIEFDSGERAETFRKELQPLDKSLQITTEREFE